MFCFACQSSDKLDSQRNDKYRSHVNVTCATARMERQSCALCVSNLICFLVSVSGFWCVEKRHEFERRRKLHYNEFEAVRRARQLMERDDDDDENVENDHSNFSAGRTDHNMDMDDDEDDNKVESGSSRFSKQSTSATASAAAARL